MRLERGLKHPTLDTIVAAYSAVVIERQMLLQKLVEGAPWSLDLRQQVLTVGARTLRVSPLAHVATDGETWQWASSDGSPARTGHTELIEIGRRLDIPELTTRRLPLSAIHDGGQGPAHTLAIAACGLLAGRGYFPAAYDAGTAWLLVREESLEHPALDVAAVGTLLRGATSLFPHADRLAVETYLGVHRLSARDDGDRITAEVGGRRLEFIFDSADRLRDVSAAN
ncbi:DUF6882 domain-containing protein [Cumulibacter soli]|uniref:DUF6882 domain-containing protein n=1 Tax=Cumulibacter soli TaxID=2546344 RepID=UPI00106747BC|nr:DUF6882 domain-containing protein [Cumulibacter soli]